MEYERDELRARFTVWIEILIKNARNNYLKKHSSERKVLSLQAVGEDEFLYSWEDSVIEDNMKDQFYFEEINLARAYAELPLMRQQILKMLFVNEMKPNEIARKLHCSVNYVYNQRYLGISYLRERLTESGEMDGNE